MMSGSKAPDFDAYGLFRAAHSHVSAPLRPVLQNGQREQKGAVGVGQLVRPFFANYHHCRKS